MSNNESTETSLNWYRRTRKGVDTSMKNKKGRSCSRVIDVATKETPKNLHHGYTPNWRNIKCSISITRCTSKHH